MESIKDIKAEILRLTEAIAAITQTEVNPTQMHHELKNLAHDLSERVYLLKFAYQVFEEQQKNSAPQPEVQAEIEPEVVAKKDEEQEILEETETPLESQKVLNETTEEETENISPTASIDSINDKISQLSKADSLANKLQNQPIKNLKTAIGLNERFLFANELFNGDGVEYQRAIEEFNHLSNMDDALRLIEYKYQNAYKWDFDSQTVITFLSYLQRRFKYSASA